MKKRKWARDQLKVVSRKFTEVHELPHGSKVVLRHVESGRKARSDRVLKYRRFKERAPDDCTVSQLLDAYLCPRLSIDLYERGLVPKLVGPYGETIVGNTKLRTVRRWEARPTSSEIEERQYHDAEIEEIANEADHYLASAESGRDPDLVCSGVVQALVQRFGEAEVEKALSPA